MVRRSLSTGSLDLHGMKMGKIHPRTFNTVGLQLGWIRELDLRMVTVYIGYVICVFADKIIIL